MSIDDMHRIRQIIDCAVCDKQNLDLCRKLLTQEQRNQYAEKYGCICGCNCHYCKDKEGCDHGYND